jgi:hypothetical protein
MTKDVFDFGTDLSNAKPKSKNENNEAFELPSVLLLFFMILCSLLVISAALQGYTASNLLADVELRSFLNSNTIR